MEIGIDVYPETVVVSQGDAEAGTSTAERIWTAQRVKQAIEALAGTGGGDLLAANNLDDVASPTTSRINLGLAIGSDVHPHMTEVSQAEAEAGIADTERSWTAERVKQAIAALETGGGASELSDLSDVGSTTPTNKRALMADGNSWESRAIVEADISNLGSYEPVDSTLVRDDDAGYNKSEWDAAHGWGDWGGHNHTGVYEPADGNLTKDNVNETISVQWNFTAAPKKSSLGIPYHVSSGYTGGKITVSGSEPGTPTKGDIWFDTS